MLHKFQHEETIWLVHFKRKQATNPTTQHFLAFRIREKSLRMSVKSPFLTPNAKIAL